MPLPMNWDISGVLKLQFYRGLNPSHIRHIVESYSSYDEFIHAELPPELNLIINQGELFRRGIKKPDVEAEKQIEKCENFGVKIITFWDSRYPDSLKQIHHPPTVIYTKGHLRESSTDCLAIVGTRRCSTYGRLNSERFSDYFSKRGIIIVSGLARGIDTFAHNVAKANNGNTYAVVASGLDKISPHYSNKNAEEIIDLGGAIISIFPCSIAAKPPYFLQRNRIISGLSKATLVIESRFKGGALNTARFARDQDREVFALPGNISSEQSEGTNDLIKRGLAQLASSPENLYKELSFENSINFTINDVQEIVFNDNDEKEIYDKIGFEPLHVDEISRITNMEIQQLLVTLLNLEFSGVIRQLPGKYYVRQN